MLGCLGSVSSGMASFLATSRSDRYTCSSSITRSTTQMPSCNNNSISIFRRLVFQHLEKDLVFLQLFCVKSTSSPSITRKFSQFIRNFHQNRNEVHFLDIYKMDSLNKKSQELPAICTKEDDFTKTKDNLTSLVEIIFIVILSVSILHV